MLSNNITVTLHLSSGRARRSVAVAKKAMNGHRATQMYTDSFKEFSGRSLSARTNRTNQSKGRKSLKKRIVSRRRISSLSCPAAPFNSTESLMSLRQASPVIDNSSVYGFGFELDFFGSAASMFGGFKQDS
jgi:hypothetical protein